MGAPGDREAPDDGPDEADELAELESWRNTVRWPARFGAPIRLVCRCACVEEHEVQALIDQGCGLEDIAAKTGATRGCASCRPSVLSMLEAAGRRGPRFP